MKRITFLCLSLLICYTGCKTIKPAADKSPDVKAVPATNTAVAPAAVNFSDQSTWLLGYLNPVQLTYEPYSAWYIKGYDDYQLNSEAINKLLDINKDDLKIKVVMGTWCSDSRREVPRFIRILDVWQFPVTDLTIIGVDDAKFSPLVEYDKLGIQRVPTFIFYKNNIEVGRIIEVPSTSLEQDMVNILTRNE